MVRSPPISIDHFDLHDVLRVGLPPLVAAVSNAGALGEPSSFVPLCSHPPARLATSPRPLTFTQASSPR